MILQIHAWKNIWWSYLLSVSNHTWRLKLVLSLLSFTLYLEKWLTTNRKNIWRRSFWRSSPFPNEVAWVRGSLQWNQRKAEGEKGIEYPISSNNDRKRAATRNTTKNTTTSVEATNKYSESDPDDKDYAAQLPKKKLNADAPKKTKKKTSCDKGKKRMTKEQNKSKWKNNATLSVPLAKEDSINFYAKIERIESMTPYEIWSSLFTDAMFDNLVEQT